MFSFDGETYHCDKYGLARCEQSKKDEPYTQLPDIEKELKYYRKHFRGKTVYCNCNDLKLE